MKQIARGTATGDNAGREREGPTVSAKPVSSIPPSSPSKPLLGSSSRGTQRLQGFLGSARLGPIVVEQPVMVDQLDGCLPCVPAERLGPRLEPLRFERTQAGEQLCGPGGAKLL